MENISESDIEWAGIGVCTSFFLHRKYRCLDKNACFSSPYSPNPNLTSCSIAVNYPCLSYRRSSCCIVVRMDLRHIKLSQGITRRAVNTIWEPYMVVWSNLINTHDFYDFYGLSAWNTAGTGWLCNAAWTTFALSRKARGSGGESAQGTVVFFTRTATCGLTAPQTK